MSLARMFNIGLLGLKAHRQAMNVTSDNISNMNTVGFKGARVNFRDMLDRSVLGGAGIGSGVEVSSVQRLFNQGAITHGDSPLDFALAGDGFFMVEGQFNGAQGEFYTRAGQFQLDRDGFVVTDSGLKLQAYPFDANEVRSSLRTNLQIPQSTLPPRATASMNVVANLSSETAVGGAFDVNNLGTTTDHASTIEVYDSLGQKHDLTLYFTRTATGWDWNVVADGGELTGGTPGTPTVVGNGSVTFDANGALDSLTPATPSISANFVGAAPGQTINLNFGSSVTGGGTGLDGLTQHGSKSLTKLHTQNGYGAGELEHIELNDEGILVGYYDNGEDKKIAQLSIARFTSREGLNRLGGNLYTETPDSGEPIIGTAGNGKNNVYGNALEESNVDVATEFVNMIKEQRAFSASSRSITTADEMFTEVINLKR
ncbi:MAG: flagellar hook protein FlgE [Myxococcota bacterium]|nr:flagellar hook protein FlgE [Myxococcota bacterium]